MTHVEQASPSTPQAPTRVRRTLGGAALDLAGPTLLTVLVCVLASFVIEHRVEARVAKLMQERPQIAVVDDIGLVRLAISNGADRFNPAEVTAEIERMVAKAGLQDTILVSQSMVMYTPPQARISTADPEPESISPVREIGP